MTFHQRLVGNVLRQQHHVRHWHHVTASVQQLYRASEKGDMKEVLKKLFL
jgi:hypothetical protein